MKSKAFRRKVAIISLLCIMMIVSLVSITVSWFKNAIDAVGPDINTGKIDVSLTEYHFDGTQWNSVMKYSSPEDTAEEYTKLTTLDSFSMDLSGGSAQDDVFYVIKKNEGSIPLDVSLGFVVDGYDAAASVVGSDFEVIGGFWYRLENVTEEYREAESYFTTGENNPVKTENKDLYKQLYLINSDVRTSRLDTDDVAVFRLTCGYVNHDNGVVNRYNKSYDLNINFCVSQLGGLDGSAGGDIHYVSTEDELRNRLNEYKPGDGIFLESDITFYGDLIIDRPLKLYVQGHTLNIEGNLTVSYPDRGNFLINTQRGGKICVKKIGNSGSMIVDIPNAKLELIGSGNEQIGKGDIYIENEYYVSASYSDGLIISSSYIRDLSDVDEDFKDMTIGDSTRVSVSSNTQVGKLVADTNASLICINNYGTIETVDFRNIAYEELTAHVITDQTVNNISVQSRLENAGIIDEVYLNKDSLPGMTTNGLLMRYNENRYIDENDGRFHGNTRLINRLGGQIGDVHSSAEISYVDNSKSPIHYVIEEDINITYVEKLLTDDNGEVLTTNEFIIRYTNRYDESGQPNLDTTLADVLDWYEGDDLNEAYKFTIVCYGGKVLTEEDYNTLKTYSSLVQLDLSGALSQDGVTPAKAFSSLSRLEYLLLPNDSTLSANAFEGTALDEVTLQSSYSTIEENAFTDTNGNLLIKYLHLMQSGAEYNNLIPAKQFIFVVDDVTLTTLRAKYPSYHHRFFIDAEKYGDYFIRVISDDVCEMAVYVGGNFIYTNEHKNLQQEANQYSSFDFNEFSYRENGEIKTLKVNSFDDYAFYGMIKNTNNSVALHFKNAKNIGDYAFSQCTGIMDSVTFSGTVSIGSYAFSECTNIKHIFGVDASNSKIGRYAFAKCTNIVEVYAPGFTHVGAYAFKDCKNVTAIRMPQLYSMGQEAFFQASNVEFLETALIISGDGWSGIHGDSIKAFPTDVHNSYDPKSHMNYIVNFEGLPKGMEIPESLPNVLQYGTTGHFYNWTSFMMILAPTGYEKYVAHMMAYETRSMVKFSENYTGNGKYLKLNETTGICEYWDTPYRFVKTESEEEFVPADYLYEEVTGGARLIACFDMEITGDYYLPDVIIDGDREIKVTEMDARVFFTTHLGKVTDSAGSTVYCSLYLGENIRYIADNAFQKSLACTHGTYTSHIERKINVLNLGGLKELTPCIVGNGNSQASTALEIYAPNVTVIKPGALVGDTKGILLDDTHFPALKIIENEAISTNNKKNNNIISVNLSLLTSVGDNAFNGCTALVSVTAPALKTIGASAFSGCKALTSIHAPNTISLGANAFYGCTGFVSVSFPSVMAIESAAFSGCSNLREISMNSVETIGDSTFIGLTSLTTVNMPNLKTIGASAFLSATALTTVNIPKVTSLGKDAFMKCTSLESIDLPSIIIIDNAAFSGCSKLKTITAASATTLGEAVFSGVSTLNTVDIPKVTSLGKDAFKNCTSLESIELPSIIEIKNAAFTGCSRLKTISAASATTLGESVFSNLSALTTVNIPKVTSLGKNAFSNCASLEFIEIPSIIEIKNAAFTTCTKLSFVSAESVETIADYAFSSLKALTGVYMPNVVKLGASCFQSCSSLAAFSSEDLIEVGKDCFNGCTALKTIDMPKLTAVSENCFRSCALVNVYLPSATSIGNRGFEGNLVLKTLNIPKVTYLGLNAFYSCNLWWINMPSFVHTTSNASWNGGFKGAVYGNLGSYTGTDKVSIFRVSNDKIYLVTYTTGKSFSSAYDPSDIIILRSDGTEITYDKIWREWTAEEEEIPFRIYIKGEDANTVTLAFLNGFFADELVEGKYTLQKSLILNGQTYQVTGVLNGVASKFDFEGRSLVLPVAIKDIPEYFAYQNTTLGGISAMGVNNDIGQYAFYGCTALKSAEFPNAISLQQHAFNGCSSLFNINLNALQRIEGGQINGASVGGHFMDCTSLVSVSFPSLTYIQDYVNANSSNFGIFEGCTSLASVSFGSGFNQTLKARNMFKNATSLAMVTFDGCPTIDIANNWSLPASANIFVSYTNYDAFRSKNSAYATITYYYEDVYTDAETGIVYYLKEQSSGEYEIMLIEFPADYALDKVVLPSVYNGKNIISLSNSAWKGLENQRIKIVALPKDFKFFNNKEAVADSIESFEISEENSVFSTVDGVLYSKDGSVLIAYPKSKLGESFALPATVTMISSKAFSGTVNLVTLTIDHKVTICDAAFYDCEKLQNVVFTGTETSSFIGTQTFMDCDLENSITVWIPLGTIDSYKNAVIEDIDLYSKFIEGTPNT